MMKEKRYDRVAQDIELPLQPLENLDFKFVRWSFERYRPSSLVDSGAVLEMIRKLSWMAHLVSLTHQDEGVPLRGPSHYTLEIDRLPQTETGWQMHLGGSSRSRTK